MKKPIIMIYLITSLLIMTACGGTPATQGQTAGNNSGSAANQSGSTNSGSSKDNTKYLDVGFTNALPLTTQLIIGTLKLKGTANDVDAATAKELIPLWKAVKSLSSSDTTSPLEMEGLYKQIQRTMTPEQIAAIGAMKLSRDNMMQISQELGLAMGGGAGMGTMTAEQKSTMEANRTSSGGASAGGGMMGGGPGGGIMGGGPPGQSSSSSGTSVASAPQVSQVDTNLVDALIKYLESRIQQ